MADAFTANLNLNKQEVAAHNNTWGGTLNTNFAYIDSKIGDRTTISSTGGTTTLSETEQKVNVIKLTGTLSSNFILALNATGGTWIIDNQMVQGAYSVTVKVTGQAGFTLAALGKTLVYYDGSDAVAASVPISPTGVLGISSGGTGQITAAAAAVALGVVTAGSIFGLTLSNDSGGTTAIAVAAGSARDSTDVDTMVLAAALTGKVLGTAWSVGSAGGLLDTGAISNAWYYIFLIKRTDTGVVDALASLSATAPTMPTNYTEKRRIGAVQRTGGAIRTFSQTDDKFLWKVPVQDVATSNPGTAAVTPTLSIPAVQVEADIALRLYDITPSGLSPTRILVTSPSQTDTDPTTVCQAINLSPDVHVEIFAMVPTSNGTIRYRLDASDADRSIVIVTNGWRDARGRLS